MNKTTPGWITNSPEAAAKLRAADAAYDRRVAAAAGMLLADKIEAIRTAKAIREAAYRAVEQPGPDKARHGSPDRDFSP